MLVHRVFGGTDATGMDTLEASSTSMIDRRAVPTDTLTAGRYNLVAGVDRLNQNLLYF